MTSPQRLSPVLVTGAAGFVGANVVRALLEQGSEVHVLLRERSDPWRLRGVLERLHVHRADLTDERRVREVVDAVRPAVVEHLATHGAYESQADARLILRTNVLGTYNLLEACAELGVRLFVNTGSSSEYGLKTHPMRETDRLEPNSFYSVAKSAQSHLCSLVSQRSQMAAVVFRLFSTYGPWEEPTRLIPTLIRRIWSRSPLEMTSPETARDFVYVDDVVRALIDFPRLESLRGEVFNLASGLETTLGDVVAAVQKVLGQTAEVRWGSMRARHWDTDHWCGDATKAKQVLGWQPRFSLEDGLNRMAEWMRQTTNSNAGLMIHAA